MEFIPDDPVEVSAVPFFDDVRADEGWAGHATTKTVEQLKSEMEHAVTRLDGVVTSFVKGRYNVAGQERHGFQVQYSLVHGGKRFVGRIDAVALPVRPDTGRMKTYEKRLDRALRQCLFQLRDVFNSFWYLEKLSPGFAGLMPWMVPKGETLTVSQLWAVSGMKAALPVPKGDVVDAEFEEIEE